MSGISLVIMVVLLGGMTFLMGRRQKKEQQTRQELLNNMKIGDSVITIGGLHGVISEIDTEKNTVILDCEGIFLEFNRSAIAKVESGIIQEDTAETIVDADDVAEKSETEDKE